MAHNSRFIKVKIMGEKPNVKDIIEVSQNSVVDMSVLEQNENSIGFHIDDVPKVVAALLEMRRFRGHSMESQYKEISKIVKKWDKKKNYS